MDLLVAMSRAGTQPPGELARMTRMLDRMSGSLHSLGDTPTLPASLRLEALAVAFPLTVLLIKMPGLLELAVGFVILCLVGLRRAWTRCA